MEKGSHAGKDLTLYSSFCTQQTQNNSHIKENMTKLDLLVLDKHEKDEVLHSEMYLRFQIGEARRSWLKLVATGSFHCLKSFNLFVIISRNACKFGLLIAGCSA
jgi:hypothetical protein